jgi:hypothetical protein
MGRIVAPRDAEALGLAILEVLSRRPAAVSLEAIRKRHTPSTVAATYLQLFRDLGAPA